MLGVKGHLIDGPRQRVPPKDKRFLCAPGWIGDKEDAVPRRLSTGTQRERKTLKLQVFVIVLTLLTNTGNAWGLRGNSSG